MCSHSQLAQRGFTSNITLKEFENASSDLVASEAKVARKTLPFGCEDGQVVLPVIVHIKENRNLEETGEKAKTPIGVWRHGHLLKPTKHKTQGG